MWKKFIEFIKSIFKSSGKPTSSIDDTPNSVPVVTAPPKENTTGEVSYDVIARMVIGHLEKYLGAKEKGNNTDKGGPIDMIIKYMGGKLGWAWCAATVCYCVKKTCEDLGISYPQGLYKGFSSQSLWHETNKKYIILYSKDIAINLYGWAFVATNPKDRAHGHTGYCTGKIDEKGFVTTIEGNDADQIKRDYRKASLASSFVNIPQAILDQYNREKKLG